jgi:CRP/FNR family cyclic AMP-dependent transcriptional regulator
VCSTNPAVKWPLLAVLSEGQARDLLSVARRRKFAKGQAVFHEGDPADALHLLDKGKVAVRVTTPLGDTATLRILAPGGWFGELALLAPAPRVATVIALEPVETLALHRDHFEELRRSHPDIDRLLLEAAVSEVRRLSARLLEALYVPVAKRLPRRLLELAEIYGGTADQPTITLTQDDFAGLCGATRPTVNQLLMQLQEAGVVRVGRARLTVVDRHRLEQAAR